MVDLLQEIAERTNDENPYLGDSQARVWQARLNALPDDSPTAERMECLVMLAEYESLKGQEQLVIERLEEAYQVCLQLGEQETLQAKDEILYRLGVAYLRYGETQNCCARHSAESCILPIRGQGIHRDEEGSRKAIDHFQQILSSPNAGPKLQVQAKWLLNLAYMTIDAYPDDVPEAHRIPPSAFASDEAWPRFANIAPNLELDTFNLSGGAIADDFDGDGYLDIVTSTFDTSGAMRFFRNNGDGSFSERSESAGLSGLLGGLNMVQADYNNDGHTDILVLRGAWLMEAGNHPNSLIRNNGDGTFTDVTFEAGLGEPFYPTQTAAWADYDNDGDLDLYVGNEHVGKSKAPSQLFRNNGDGTFTDVAQQARVSNRRFAKGVTWGDYNNDRYPDLYVSNMGSANRLYRNNGDGTFTDVARRMKVTGPTAAFPTWFWDFDNDGNLDLYVAANFGRTESLASLAQSYLGMPFADELACLYRGDGGGGFVESAAQLGLNRLVLPMGSNFGDLDNDGFLDFYLGTGYPSYDALMPNVMYHNQSGRRFADITWNGGFGHLQKGHGIAFADFDHDGDQDIYAQMGGAKLGDKFNDALFENPGFDNNWIALQLVGTRSNRSAIGARIRLVIREGEEGAERSVYRRVNSGGSFGANPLRQTIGVGQAEEIARMEIFWPTSDTTQRFENVTVNRMIRITEGEGELEAIEFGRFQFPRE